ncbi:MAG TPA: SMR family transporter [Steroidobacteraceae bacterium]|nr:SMR family transporter [Steroidobacteraceae bacterium]
MSPTAFALIVTGVLLNATAQLLLKAGVKVTGQIDLSGAHLWSAARALAFEPHILGGLLCYVASVIVWILALSRVEVSIAYPMLSIGYIVTAVAAWHLFGESLTATRVAGIAVIIAGVYLVARSG